ncbi:MAG: redoxin domain-containing protein [Bacteroidota bacterium]|nr:redoxin domain-containing protein [Bacteroidota bacterium]
MSSSLNKYPHFELLEIEPELNLTFKKYKALSPLRKGDVAPVLTFANDFNAWRQFLNGAGNNIHLSARQLLSKPLVISFYSHHWKSEGLDFITRLSEINTAIKANGGNHIVITDGCSAELEKAAWDNNLTLNFYFDSTGKLAEAFGVFDANSPVWERFSGIDAHVPLLAYFVVTPYNQVVFSQSNWSADQPLQSGELLDAVYKASLDLNARKSA